MKNQRDDVGSMTRPHPLRVLIVRHRKLIMLVGLFWFGLVMAGGIFLSTLDARSGLHIFGSNTWRPGETSVLRVSLRDLQLDRSRALGEVRGTFFDKQGRPHSPFVLSEEAGPYRQGNVRAPTHAGVYQIKLTAMDMDVPMQASFTVSVQSAETTPQPISLIEPPKPNHRNSGTTTFSLRPLDGVLANGLPDQLVLFASQMSSGPQSVALEMTFGHSSVPVPANIHLGIDGLALIPIQAAHPFFEFAVSSPDSRTFTSLKPVATQFTLNTKSPRLDEENVILHVRSLHRDGPVFVDLWHHNHWIASRSAQLVNYRAKIQLPRPSSYTPSQLVWIRAYRNAYLPGTARGGRHFIVDDANAPSVQTLGQRMLASKGGDQGLIRRVIRSTASTNEKLRILLGQIVWPEIEPPLLLDSGRTHIQTVQALKTKWQSRFVMTLAGSGCAFSSSA